MLKLIPAIVETRDLQNISSGAGASNIERYRYHQPFVYHIPIPSQHCYLIPSSLNYYNNYLANNESSSTTNIDSNHHHQSQQPRLFINNQDSILTQCFWTFFWLAMIIFISYPLSIIVSFIYLLWSPILVLINHRNGLNSRNSRNGQNNDIDIDDNWSKLSSILLWLMHSPLICTYNMIIAKSLF